MPKRHSISTNTSPMSEWWETEGDALDHALSRVAQWAQRTEQHSDEETSSASYSSSISTATCDEDDWETSSVVRDSHRRGACASAAAPQRNRSRDRQQEEMVALRAEIWQLEGLLRDLRLGKVRTPTRETSARLVDAWEEMAASQLVTRLEAEQLNKKLRDAVMEQARVTEELIALIRRAERVAGVGFMGGLRIPADFHERVSTSQQWQRLQVLATRWREAFELCDQFQNGPDVFTDSRIIQIDDHGGIVDLYASAAVPFPCERVSEALWLHCQEPIAQSDYHSFTQVLESSGPHPDFRLASEFSVRGPYGCVYGKCVKQRLRTKDGCPLFVTHSNVEPKRPCDPQFDIPMYQDSWVRLVAKPGPVDQTVMQTVRRSCIQFSRDEMPPPRKVAEGLARFILQIMDTETKWAKQSVENTLMRPADTMLCITRRR